MLEAFRYKPVRKAAEKALVEITPLVPTWNKPALPEFDIVPPEGLDGFWKLDWGDSGIRLEHQTPGGEAPYIHTQVEQLAGELKVTESLRDTGGRSLYTEIVFEGKRLVGGSTWVNRDNTEKPSGVVRRRIKRTLQPKLPAIKAK